ncbi:MAG: hypothetical protein NT151_04895 [Acidobacteria bacterium]|nr:hypothetical protein [Acidobacteriota bacterium]
MIPSNTIRAIGVSRPQFNRGLAIAGLVALVAFPGGCSRAPQPIHIDLLSLLARADKRPPSRPGEAFVVRDVQFDGRTIPAVIVPQPSRIVWTVRIPRRATLTTHAGLAPDRTGKYAGDAVFRIGVSGGKLYEKVYERRLTPNKVEADRSFVPIAVDLSAWAGWQWSLFYRPSERAWNVVFSVDGTKSSDTPLWLAPAIKGVK